MASLVVAKVLAVSFSLLASGGVFALSLFDIPELRAQPASRSLPSIRWLFSRGSHIFPQSAVISSVSFATLAYHAYQALPAAASSNAMLHSLVDTHRGWAVLGYVLASVLTLSIAPFTSLVMIPTVNFELIQLNLDLGGSRSQASAQHKQRSSTQQQQRTAKESVNGKGDINELTDLSDPQAVAGREASEGQERRVRALLDRFGWMNGVRGALLALGGVVGLVVMVASG